MWRWVSIVDEEQSRFTWWFPCEPEWVFKIKRILLSSTDPRKLTLFIFYTGVMDWEIRRNLGALFFSFMISCLRHIFLTRIPSSWRWISRKWERFFFGKRLSKKTSLIFYIAITVWELQVAFWRLLFLLKSRRLVKTCHILFIIVSILGKGLEFKVVSWKRPLVLYISL